MACLWKKIHSHNKEMKSLLKKIRGSELVSGPKGNFFEGIPKPGRLGLIPTAVKQRRAK